MRHKTGRLADFTKFLDASGKVSLSTKVRKDPRRSRVLAMSSGETLVRIILGTTNLDINFELLRTWNLEKDAIEQGLRFAPEQRRWG